MRNSKWDEPDRLASACPGANDPNHRTGPMGYLARANWADQMIKTHVQSQCPKCELWVIWKPKPRVVGKMGLSGNAHVDNRRRT